jgi:aspartyl-tRNA(Asn)/glutamyl-tRNA(Gln) amidotransferase subunit A
MPVDTILDAARALRSGETTSIELTASMLSRADECDARLGSFLSRYDETALAAAAQADADFAAGIDRGPLQGIPLGIKDIITTREGATTAQSLILDPDWGSRTDAVVVARLRAAGAVIMGKTSTMEFAIGLPDPDKPFPIPRNPWNLNAWTGGSSSGTGNGVAAGLFLGGLGTDTGGSIRIPAAYCGISGLKPTFGRVPKSGCVPLGYSLDHIGPMARSAADCAVLLQALAGHDATDPYSKVEPVPDYLNGLCGDLNGLRIGAEYSVLDSAPIADPAMRPALSAAVESFVAFGARASTVELDCYQDLVAVDMITMLAEAFGYHRPDLERRWSEYGRATRRFLAQGALLSAGDVVQAQRLRRHLVHRVAEMFEDIDVLVMPLASTGAPLYGSLDLGDLMGTLFAGAWNTVGLPVAVVPAGFTADGMPLSLQIVGRPMEETTVLRVAHAFQRLTDFHRYLPPLRPESLGSMMPSYPPVAVPDGEEAERVDALLRASALHPPEHDRAAIVAGYAALRRSADGLYRSLGEIDPMLAFDAVVPTRAGGIPARDRDGLIGAA